jgi:transposase-like protein
MNTQKVTQEYRMNQWIGIIRECRESGQTVISWCKEHDIDTRKYYYWLQKIRAAACKTLPPINKEGSIVPVETHESSLSTLVESTQVYKEAAVADIVIRLGSAVLEIHNNASASLIENAIKALNNAR